MVTVDRVTGLLAAALIALAGPSAASASTLVQIYGEGTVYYDDAEQLLEYFGFSGFEDSFAPLTPGTSSNFPSLSDSGGAYRDAGGPGATSAYVEGRARASLGVLGVGTESVLNAPLVANHHLGNVNVSATFADDLTIVPDDPMLLGTSGTFSGVLLLTGSLSAQAFDLSPVATPSGSSIGASWTTNLVWSSTLGDYDSFLWTGSVHAASLAETSFTGEDLPAALAFELPFVFGRTYELRVFLVSSLAGVAAVADGNVAASVALFDSLRWGGVTGLKDTGGAQVPYDVISASGANWVSAAVPEASALGLVLVSLAGLCVGRGPSSRRSRVGG